MQSTRSSRSGTVGEMVDQIATLYSQYGAWDDLRKKTFTAALSDLSPTLVRVAIAKWAKTATKPPLPGDIRAICEQLPVIETAERNPHRKIYHPGEGIGGNRPPVVMPDPKWNATARAQYFRMATETAEVLRQRREEARTRRKRNPGDPELAGDILWPAMESLMHRWLKRDRHCGWCRAVLTEESLKPYLEWCRDLGQHRPIGTPMPEDKVFCNDCAPGAISELIDGIRYDAVPF